MSVSKHFENERIVNYSHLIFINKQLQLIWVQIRSKLDVKTVFEC